jgi:hypothetical protein
MTRGGAFRYSCRLFEAFLVAQRESNVRLQQGRSLHAYDWCSLAAVLALQASEAQVPAAVLWDLAASGRVRRADTFARDSCHTPN